MDVLDRIEREIAIDASAARVWKLVSEPGWYVNDKEIVPHRIERRGDLHVVHDPTHGTFAFATVELDEPRYAAFRWLTDADAPDGPSTLVEFRIEETSPTSVVLKVIESGFASLPESAEDRRSRYDNHVGGWQIEMALAKGHVEEAVDAIG